MLNTNPKIEDVGLQKYLDQTADQHRNFTYANFQTMVQSNVDKSNIARAFGVNRKTIYRWLEVYEKEVAS